tara:strand:- start:41 stop:319 length:279 start_codon:yes stop_codon:yes gene_type:complete
MKQGYYRYLEAKTKRAKAKEDTPEIVEEIQLAYKEAFEEHRKWIHTKDKSPQSKIEGQAMHPDMVRDLSTFFGDAIGGFPSKFNTPLKNKKK